MMDTPTPDKERNFARIDVGIPVRIRVVEQSEAAAIATRMQAEPTYSERISSDSAGQGKEKASWERLALVTALERLERLESLLSRVADALGVDLTEPGSWIEGESVNLSGAGIGIHLPVRIPEDSLVEIELTMLGEPTGTVRAIGRVVCLVHPDGDQLPVGRYHLGISFEAIHDADRQAVIRYTFTQQRAQLREMKS